MEMMKKKEEVEEEKIIYVSDVCLCLNPDAPTY